MITLNTILVATDFGDAARAALAQGRALADSFDASLHILHVVTEPLHEAWLGFVPGQSFVQAVDRLEDEARQKLEELSCDLSHEHRVVLATPWGEASDGILEYARTHNVDLIVCGTHGRRGWDRLLMGSVAERVVRLAPCPVLTVYAAGTIAAAA